MFSGGGYSSDVEITAEVTEEDINEETLPEEESVSDDQAIMISDPNSGDSAISADTAEEIIKMDEEENGDVLQFDMEESDSASEEAKADVAGDDPWGTPAADWYNRYEYTLSGNEIILEKRAVSVNDGVRAAVDIYDNSVDITSVEGTVLGRDFYVTIPGNVEIDGKTYNVVLKPQWYLTHVTELDKVTSNLYHEYNVYHVKLKSGVSFYENSAAQMFASKILDMNAVATGGLPGYQWHPDEVVFDHVDFSNVTSMYGMFGSFGPHEYGLGNGVGYRKIDFGEDIDTSAVTRMDYMFYGCDDLASLDLSGFDTSAVTTMDYMFYGCSGLKELDLSSFNTADVGNGEALYKYSRVSGQLRSIEFLPMPAGMSYMFDGCSELTKLNISSFDTKNVKNMSGMFSGCAKLEGLDLTKFDTSSVSSQYIVDTYSNGQGVVKGTTGMSGMFSGCSKLKKLDLSSFNTSGVRSMDKMFSACSSLEELDISSFDTSAVADIPYPKNCDENGGYSFGSMAYMFSGCSSLEELDLGSFDLTAITELSSFLTGCDSLEKISTPRNLPEEEKVELPTFFYDESGTIYYELPHRTDSIVLTCDSKKTAWFYEYDFEVGDGIFRLKKAKDTLTGNVTVPAVIQINGADYSVVLGVGVYKSAGKVTGITFEKGVKVEKSCFEMFDGCSALTKLDLSGLDISAVTNMSFMFFGCSALTSLDLSGLDTSKVTNMSSMFTGCSTLKSVDLSSLDLSGIRTETELFDGALETLHTPKNVNTWVRIKLPGVFFDAENNAYAELPHLSESIVLTADKEKNAFIYDYDFTISDGKVHLKKLKNGIKGNITVPAKVKLNGVEYGVALGGEVYSSMSEITDITFAKGVCTDPDCTRLFKGCTGLSSLDLSGLDTTGLGSTSAMFSGCSNLKELKLDGWDLSAVSYASGMFIGCTSLSSLDLRALEMPKLYKASAMFEGCSGMTELKLGKMLSDYYEVDVSSMFQDCSSLETLDISGLKDANLKKTALMFEGCKSLVSLDVSCLDTSKVTEMNHMFKDCCSLTELNLSGISTASATSLAGMFWGCSSLKTIDVSAFNTSKVNYIGAMFKDCSSVTALDLSSFACKQIGLYAHTDLLEGCTGLVTIKTPANIPSERLNNPTLKLPYIMYDADGTAYTEIPHTPESIVLSLTPEQKAAWYQDYQTRLFEDYLLLDKPNNTLKGDIVVESKAMISGKEYSVSLNSSLYYQNENVTGIKIESDVYVGGSCYQLFQGCKNLKKLDLARLDASRITWMVFPFDNLTDIETPLNLPASVTVSLQEENDEWEAFCDKEGTVYTALPHLSNSISLSRKAKNNGGGGNEEPGDSDILLNGEKVGSLGAAFKQMKENIDYVLVIGADVKGEKNLTIPKSAKSVTIKGNGHSIEITGTRLTAYAPLTLNDVKILAKTKKGGSAKFTLSAKKGLYLGEAVSFEAAKTSVNAASVELDGSLQSDVLSCKELVLKDGGVLTVSAGNRITVKTCLKGNGGSIVLKEGFNKPIVLNGTVEGVVSFGSDSAVADGTQIIKASQKKIPADKLKEAFDVSAVTDNEVATHLYYYSGGKAGIFGEAVSYNGENYALWKDVIAKMNTDKASDYVIELYGDVNVKGALKLPKKGYQSLTINGNGHTLSFTGNIKLTGNTVVKDTVLKKLDKKGRQQSGKVVKGKFTYEGPETF